MSEKWKKALYRFRYVFLAIGIYVVGTVSIVQYIYLPLELKDAKRNKEQKDRRCDVHGRDGLNVPGVQKP